MAGARQPGLAAGEAWANCVVSHTIIQHADRSTQAILARVSKGAFNMVVPVLW